MSAIGHEYRVSVGMRRFHDGEVFAGKGVLCCKIKTQQGIVAVFTTHVSLGLFILTIVQCRFLLYSSVVGVSSLIFLS